MKKKLVGLLASILTVCAVSVTAFAMPSHNCYTTITSANRVATGVTTCTTATYCSVVVVGNYSGGTKEYSNSGVSATSAAVRVNAPYQFTTATSSHRIDYYDNGYLNTFKTSTGAGASR